MRNGLSFFRRTNSPGHWNIAAYHSPHSLTWQWVLSFALFRADEWRVWPIWMPERQHEGLFQWTARIPFVGFLRWHRQKPMWYRDMYITLRERVDQQTGMLWLPDNHPNKIHRKPVEPPPAPIVAEGTPTIQ